MLYMAVIKKSLLLEKKLCNLVLIVGETRISWKE